MTTNAPPSRSSHAFAVLLAGLFSYVHLSTTLAAETNELARAVTSVKVNRACFTDTLQVTGTIVPRNAVLVRSDREGLQVSQVLVENGDTVISGQVLARLRQPDGQRNATDVAVQAPAAGTVYAVSAMVGAAAAGREPLFRIARQSEMELLGETPVDSMARLTPDQSATDEIIGIGKLTGKVRQISPSVNPSTQLGQVIISVAADQRVRVGVFGKATIELAQRCGPALPLSAVLYGSGGQIVQVIRNDRVETRRVVVGLIRDGEAEIREGLSEGEVAVARAGAFVRDGDRVFPVAGAQPNSK